MRFDTSQSMKLGQQMKLAPRMIQSMEILQMPLAELEERIEQELENNATLEIIEPTADESSKSDNDNDDAPHELDAGSDEDFSRLDQFEADNPDAAENEYSAARMERTPEYEPIRTRTGGDPDRDGKMDAMASAPARAASLEEQLLDQWRMADIEASLRPLGEWVIENLDADGYLRASTEDLIAQAPPALRDAATPEAIERALTAVQLTLDPAGIAARDARECLLLQLDVVDLADGGESEADRADTIGLARTLVADHLDDLMNNRLPRIAERADVSLDQIKRGIELLRRLSLAPARRLIVDRPEPITPDGIVEYDEEGDRYIAYLNDTRLPNLQINKDYAELVRDREAPKRDRDFLKTNIANAQWLIEAVHQRRHTLQRVLNVVVDAQREYFDFGPQALKPLPMTQVAEQLGIHVATVSRAVADKHLMTPRGVAPLRGFFTGGTQTDEGDDISWGAIRAALQEVVDGEDKAKPLSDDALAAALKDRGIEIARRTVAKYRGQLGIPAARLRKQF